MRNPETLSLRQKYAQHYEVNKAHSPQESVISLLQRSRHITEGLGAGDVVLDIGSGRQNLEITYKRMYGKPDFTLLSMDFANLRRKQLLARDTKNVHHIQADGTALPLRDNSISLVVSNMALDFMPKEAIGEIARVLKPGGNAYINLSYPALKLENVPDLDALMASRKTTASKRNELQFWRDYLMNNDVLVSDTKSAADVYSRHGFTVQSMQEVPNRNYDWCEVDMKNTKGVIFSLSEHQARQAEVLAAD